MSNYDFGNFNRDNDYRRYQLGQQRKAAADAQVAKEQEKELKQLIYEPKQTEAHSAEALGVYGQAFFGLKSKKTDVGELGLTAADQALIAKYVTPEQQARISENMLGYFA